MTNLDSLRAHGTSFRSWFWLFSNLLFSSVLLLFLFWTLSSFLILDTMRVNSASSAHLLLVFDTPPSSIEVRGLIATMEKVSGPGSVTLFQAQDQKSPTERRNTKRILSVAVSLGQTINGQTVTLGEQISSIQQVVKNDTSIKEVVFNPNWVARVDLLAGISGGIKKVLEILLGVLCLGVSVYLAHWGPMLWVHLFPGDLARKKSASLHLRNPLFQREDILDESRESSDKEKLFSPPINPIIRILSGGGFGILAGSASVLIAWILRAFLYPGMDNPFLKGAVGSTPILNHFWISFLISCVLMGIIGGIFHLLIPNTKFHEDNLRP